MEEFDVVDEKDEIIGKATRNDCHSNPALIHRAVHFSLINLQTNAILVTKRAQNLKYDGGKLCFLGEHIKSGESWDEALKRGVHEELGFEPQKWTEIAHHIFSYAQQTEFVRFFLVEWDGEKIQPEKEEIEDIHWISLHNLDTKQDLLSEMTKYWIKILHQSTL